MPYNAVLFDLDGTLLDTLDDLADATNAALASGGYPTHPVDSYRTFVGDGVVNLIRRALPTDLRDDELVVSGMVAAMRAAYGQCWDNKTRPYDGVPEMLDELAARHVHLAVLSNKPHDFTKLCVRKLLGRWQFDRVQGVNESVLPKPDPAGAAGICRSLGLEAEEFLYLGDTDTDMKTATRAGMFAVGAMWGFRTADELTANGAAALVSHPSEVPGLL